MCDSTGGILDTRQLQAFLGAVDTGSFTRAATVLRVTQPTVTNRIKSLERMLGSILLERLPSGVRPTSAGRSLLAHAREIVRLTGEVHELVDARTEPRGRICLGAPESLTNHRLLPLIEYIYLRYPGIEFTLRQCTPQESLKSLLDGRMDCVFMIGAGAPHGDLEYRDLCPEPLALVAAPLPSSGGGGRHEKWVPGESPVLVCADIDDRYCGDLVRGAEPAKDSRRTLNLNSVEAVKRMAENGIGAALLPEIAVAQDIADGRLRKVTWLPSSQTSMQAVWRRSNVSRPALEAVLKAAADVVREG